MEEAVQVFIRVRPALPHETNKPSFKQCVKVTGDYSIELSYPKECKRPFNYDAVLSQESSEEQVFSTSAQNLLDKALQGYNSTLFVYGQTGTGKTHTMGLLKKVTQKSTGIVPCSLKYLLENASNASFTFSFFQIYLENIYDLLMPKKKALQIRQDSGNIYVKDLTNVPIENFDQAADLVNLCLNNRIMGAHNANQTSSRSHLVLSIDLEQDNSLYSRVTFVDLAGSERVSSTNASGVRLEEAKSINTSLSALGKVICALTSVGNSHIPYRDSKLTRILQPFLNGKVVLIATVSPAYIYGNETLSTLQFAARCKEVVTVPVVNQKQTPQLKKEPRSEHSDSLFSHNQSEAIYYLVRLLSKVTQNSIELKREMHSSWNKLPHQLKASYPYCLRDYEFSFDEPFMQDTFINLDSMSSGEVIENINKVAKKLVENINLLGKTAIESQFMKGELPLPNIQPDYTEVIKTMELPTQPVIKQEIKPQVQPRKVQKPRPLPKPKPNSFLTSKSQTKITRSTTPTKPKPPTASQKVLTKRSVRTKTPPPNQTQPKEDFLNQLEQELAGLSDSTWPDLPPP